VVVGHPGYTGLERWFSAPFSWVVLFSQVIVILGGMVLRYHPTGFSTPVTETEGQEASNVGRQPEGPTLTPDNVPRTAAEVAWVERALIFLARASSRNSSCFSQHLIGQAA
jgi:hypothetical protein